MIKRFDFLHKEFVHSLGDGKMYPAVLKKKLAQTVESSEVFERRILQKQPKLINKIKKTCDEITTKYLKQVCPKKAHNFLS